MLLLLCVCLHCFSSLVACSLSLSLSRKHCSTLCLRKMLPEREEEGEEGARLELISNMCAVQAGDCN